MSDPEVQPEAPPAPEVPEQQVVVEEQVFVPGPNEFGTLSDDGLEVVRFVDNTETAESAEA